MFAYVARQPILDKKQNVYAYELLFRDGKSNCFPDIPPDEATSKILANNYLTLGIEDIACHKRSFINFHRDTILHSFPTTLDPARVVIELVETVPVSDQMVEACSNIKNQGYSLALDDHTFDPRWKMFMPHVDLLKVDLHLCSFETIEKNLPNLKDTDVKLVAEKVETHEQFNRCKELGFDYFQGYFFARPEVIKTRNLPTSKLALVELMGLASHKHFDFDKVNEIIERDVGLSYMLLRFINNPTINKRQKISSLRHALNYMGEVELRKFVSLIVLANIGDDKPIELIHLSLVRARFCDSLAQEKGIGDNPPAGFLVGLFSLLDALLDQDMHAVLKKLPLADDILAALRGEEGTLKNYLCMVKALESASWIRVKNVAKALDLDQRLIHSLFNDAIVWGNTMRETVSSHFPKPN
ncbi:EAL domain-containing protein [Alteromonadaceae bacterium M269]|nr:EAL domain-containing protein [Alteromonadaceae bacterium M269]